ncbi:MAG: ATPase [Bacteroidia bacterium]|nr:ATPase [Bacteroidia bacterium]
MKKKFFLNVVFGISVLFFACTNTVKEAQVHVWGSCELAKAKIDSAAKLDGVQIADWNMETKLLTLKYDSTKVTLDNILKNVSLAGFDNERYFGDDYEYEKLPDSCKYERRVE